MSTFDAGISQCFAVVLSTFFGALTTNLATGGMQLDHKDNSHCRLWLKLSMVLQDGGAHKLVFGVKGDSGTRCCILCRNLTSVSSGLVDEDGHELLTCSIIKESDLGFADDEDIKGTPARLAAAKVTMTKDMFKIKEQAVGLNYQPLGLLYNPLSKDYVLPASQYCHDWMHTMFVAGVFNKLIMLVIFELEKSGVKNIWEQLHGYLQLWTWPSRVRDHTTLHEVFDHKHKLAHRKAQIFKASASQCLSIYAVVAFYLQTVIAKANICKKACKAVIVLADIVDVGGFSSWQGDTQVH